MNSQSIFFYLCIFFPLLLNTGYSDNINYCDINCNNNGICQNNTCICTPMFYGILCQYTKNNTNNNTYDIIYYNNTNDKNNIVTSNHTNIDNDSIFTMDTILIVIFSLSGVILLLFSIILFLHIHKLIKRRKYKRMKTISIPTIRTWARE